jgi:hypothetical protein
MTGPTPRLADLDDDTAPHPAQICIFCDDCGTKHTADYLMAAEFTPAQRHEVARAYLRTIGWSCTEAGDYCSTCAANETRV